MADHGWGPGERPEEGVDVKDESGKKRKRSKEPPTPDKKPFKLSDFALKTVKLNYKQLRLDEEQRWGQVCSVADMSTYADAE